MLFPLVFLDIVEVGLWDDDDQHPSLWVKMVEAAVVRMALSRMRGRSP